MKRILKTYGIQKTSAIAAILFLLTLQSYSQPAKPLKSGYAPVNGLKIYYEVYGEGKPLVLLHGSFMTIILTMGCLFRNSQKTGK